MTTSTPPDNTVLVLRPPMVNGQTTPVIGAHIGLRLAVYDLIDGAIVLIDPPLSGTMDPGDIMELWLENELAVLDSKTIEDPDVRTTLRIPKGRLHPDKVNKLYYTVRRGSENKGTSTPPLEILYNRIRPGLKDRLTDPGGHSELKLLLPDAIKNGVGADFVSAEVCVAYPYCRAYDLISLKCNGELLEPKPKVNPNQAPQPPNQGDETPITICFTVTRAFLDKAKRQDNKLHFSYTVTDQIGNGPDTDAPWSPVQSVDEDLDGTLLAKPILREVEGDSTDDPGTIDLEKLAGNPLLVVVLTVADKRFQVGDKITALYTASRVGLPDITQTVDGIVEADEFGEKKRCTLKVDNANVVADSSVKVTYELFRSTDDFVGKSNIATATVTGAHMQLKPASVQQANGSTLAPMAAVSRLTIVVPQGTTLPTDLLSVSWTAEPGSHAEGTYISVPRPISEIGLSIDIAPALVAFCLGGKATVSYTITRGNGQPQPSDPFILNVQELPQAELIAPRLKEAANAGEGVELKLSDLTPEGKMWFSGFPFNAVGQYVWLLFKGTNADDSTYEKYIWAAPFAFVNDDWVRNGYFETTAPYEDLKGLKDGTPLSIEMSVAFGKSEDLALAKRFLVRTYIVSAVEDVRPTITSVKGSPSNEDIPEGGTTVETAVTLTGKAAKGQKVDILDDVSVVDEAIADAITGIWTLRVSELTATDHSFTAKAKYGSGQVSQPPYDLTVIEEDIVIDQFRGGKFLNGEIRDLGNATITYTIISGNPGMTTSAAKDLILTNSFINNQQGQHKAIFDLKNKSRKTIIVTLKSYKAQDPVTEIIGYFNFIGPQGIFHTQSILSDAGEYVTREYTMPGGQSYKGFEIVQLA